MPQHIRILQNFIARTDAQLIASAGAVIKGMTGNSALPSAPVDLKALQTAIDDLNAAIAAQPNGGPAATAHKNNKRDELIAILRKLAHYVQDNCGGDLAIVLNSGFLAAAPGRMTLPLEKPTIASIVFGKTTQLVVTANRDSRAKCYEIEMASIGSGGAPGPWQSGGMFRTSRAMTVNGLTPGTTYTFRVRAFGGSTGYTDWSDPVAHICV